MFSVTNKTVGVHHPLCCGDQFRTGAKEWRNIITKWTCGHTEETGTMTFSYLGYIAHNKVQFKLQSTKRLNYI